MLDQNLFVPQNLYSLHCVSIDNSSCCFLYIVYYRPCFPMTLKMCSYKDSQGIYHGVHNTVIFVNDINFCTFPYIILTALDTILFFVVFFFCVVGGTSSCSISSLPPYLYTIYLFKKCLFVFPSVIAIRVLFFVAALVSYK